MTRIIAGRAGSLPLTVPPAGTRPTTDRVREAVFSALEARDLVSGAVVVDLYAGSGALGLEAASRGASHVVLVERSPGAARVCRRNAASVARALGPTAPPILVEARAVRTWLATAPSGLDLAFVDPPYDLPDEEVLADLIALGPLLSPDAVVVVERSARGGRPLAAPGLETVRRSAYGETAVLWLQPVGGDQPASPSHPE